MPYRIYRAMTVKTAAEDGFPVRRGERDWSAMDEAAPAEFEALFAGSDTITVDPQALERRVTILERNRALVREFRDAHDKDFVGRGGIRRWPPSGSAGCLLDGRRMPAGDWTALPVLAYVSRKR